MEKPTIDAGETFATCISRVRNPEMKSNLLAIRADIETAENEYSEMAENGELHIFPQIDTVGLVPGSEMVKTYEGRMAKKGQPGRPIYDQIKLLPENDRCPFCDHRNISTLDHVLPKQHYPILAVTPINLVACCSDCNKLKLDVAPTNKSDIIIHPYFDVVNNRKWLNAEVIESSPAALIFNVIEVAEWDNTLNERVTHHFILLDLANLYSKQAAREMSDIRLNLQRHFDLGGAEAVRTELKFQWESRRANRINSWQTATYEALSKSDWFCETGFAQT